MTTSFILKPKSFPQALSWWLSLEGYGFQKAWRKEEIHIPPESLLGCRKERGRDIVYFSEGSRIQQLDATGVLSEINIPAADPRVLPGGWKTYLRWSISGHYLLALGVWVAVCLIFARFFPDLKTQIWDSFLIGYFLLGTAIPLIVRHWALKKTPWSQMRNMVQTETALLIGLQIGFLSKWLVPQIFK